MTARDFLEHARSLGLKVSLDGDKLRVEAPTGAVTDELRQALTEHKAALIAMLESEGSAVPTKRSSDGPIPLSHFQERLWILQQLSPQSTEYNIVTAWPMGTDHPVERYPQAIQEVCARHAILRTVFCETNDGPCAREQNTDTLRIERFDLSALSTDEQHKTILEAIDTHTAQPFDLADDLPIRFGVFDLGSNGVAVLVAVHHIAIDHWSLSLLQNNIREALADPRYSQEMDELQYADYAEWSRKQMGPDKLDAQLDWWADRLENNPDLCSFPADFTPELNGRGSSVSFSWSPELTAAVQAMALANNVSVYMCMIAACAVALHGYTGQGDIVLGNSVAVRDRPELERIIGPFVNTEVLRLQVDGDMSFRDVLVNARSAVLDSHPHSQVPFELVVDRLQPARSMNRSPLFQVAVVMQNAGDGQSEPIFGGGAVHDMTWFVMMRDDRLVGSIEYRSDLFADQSVQRVLTCLESIMRSVTSQPDLTVGDIPLVSEDEREILARWSGGPASDDADPLFAQSMQEIAQSTPDRVAIRFEGQDISYGALNARANQIAHHLASQGIGAGDFVGLCVDRSADLIAAQIGILKSGAAFVPIDPRFPTDRVNYLISDCHAAAIIMDAETAGDIELNTGTTVLIVDDANADWRKQSTENPAIMPHPDDCAQVIYTSGSTGAPKGVQITQASLANLFASMRQDPGIGPDDIVAATTTVSFDISSVELLVPLTVGARIELLSRDTATDGFALSDALAETGATVVQATPSAWRLLLEADWQGGPHVLALTGGEPLTRDLADRLLERTRALWNGYGPSETTIYSTATFIEPGDDPISIGRPLRNTEVHVLNETQTLTPVGVQGEICIGGAGVAIGYLGKPDLTAEKFINNPFGTGRIYRTGDIGRWSADGKLIHLGRSDHQVKIRGVRVELGEIEAALLQVPGITEAVAAIYDTDHDDRRLVAYVTYDPTHELMASEVRHELRAKLPAYMVPSLIVDLPGLPKTPNGKLDRKALPNPYAHQRDGQSQTPPQPGTETVLAEIWREVLELDQIGAEDNFFEIGGHSLLTLRVVKQIRTQIGVELDPRVMFFKNLRQIARQLTQ